MRNINVFTDKLKSDKSMEVQVDYIDDKGKPKTKKKTVKFSDLVLSDVKIQEILVDYAIEEAKK